MSKKNWRKSFAPLVIVVALAACTSNSLPVHTLVAPEDPADVNPARVLLNSAAEKGVGIAVAVFRAGEPVWVEGIGYADLASGVAVDPQATRFRIYSVAKPMTAAAAGRLMERGRLNPNAPVQDYVPEFPVYEQPITAMQLATHTSGIRHYADDAEARSRRHCESVAEALEIFAGDPLVHDPGASETYSSWGFVLLSAVIAGASEMPYEAAMSQLLFEPAGMRTITTEDPTEVSESLSTFYEEVEGAVLPADPVDNTCKWGAGAFVATARDVAAFGAAMLDGSLLSEPTLQLFFRGADTYEAQGVGAGGVAFLLLDRSSNLSVALVANTVGNTAGPAAQQAATEIARLFREQGTDL